MKGCAMKTKTGIIIITTGILIALTIGLLIYRQRVTRDVISDPCLKDFYLVHKDMRLCLRAQCDADGTTDRYELMCYRDKQLEWTLAVDNDTIPENWYLSTGKPNDLGVHFIPGLIETGG